MMISESERRREGHEEDGDRKGHKRGEEESEEEQKEICQKRKKTENISDNF